ncbi:TolC family protein [Roseateles sp.]|uniref:TolC family protein n=1 Tax=Roseateles sp. TaxID=1971397 RepID=UPI003D0C89A8
MNPCQTQTHHHLGRRRIGSLLTLAAAMALAGCASLQPEAALAPVQEAARKHLGASVQPSHSDEDLRAVAERVGELLAAPLSADTAVQIALLNNRGLQASLAELGMAEAERVQASRLPNPGFSLGRMRRGDEREIERGASFDLGHLIGLPWARELENRRLTARQQQLTLEVLNLAADTRRAYLLAVAAQQSAAYAREVQAAAEAGAELGRRMAQAGNWNALQQAREHGFYAEAALQTARAEAAGLATRERLIRLLGLWGAQTARLTLPARLPELPAAALEQPEIEQAGLASRLDVQAARSQVEASARSLGLSRVRGFINLLELGAQRNSSNEAPVQTGYDIRFELPLFDWGDARVAKAEAVYMQSVHRAAQTAIAARSELREAYLGYRSAYDIARHHRDELLPAAKRISEQNLLRYNGMFISVFELLADTRAQIGVVRASIDALRDFWLAQAELEMARLGKPALDSAAAVSSGAAPTGAAAAAH